MKKLTTLVKLCLLTSQTKMRRKMTSIQEAEFDVDGLNAMIDAIGFRFL